MMWEFWIEQYLDIHCVARGLKPRTIDAYRAALVQFRAYVEFRLDDRNPDGLVARDILGYVEHLRTERANGGSAVNRTVTILKNFYRAVVALGHLQPDQNPMAFFPKIKAAPRKLPTFLSEEQVETLIACPRTDTVLGLRDRALLIVLYGTGIRATECSTMRECDVDLEEQTVRVLGKGGYERTVPLNSEVVLALQQYRLARGTATRGEAFFRSRGGRPMSRFAIYERVRTYGRRARITTRLSPHRLRHTFATHLIKKGVGVVTVRDLLGHHCISSTQVYLHTTAHDLRKAAALHPIEQLVNTVRDILPNGKLPFQWPPGEKAVRAG